MSPESLQEWEHIVSGVEKITTPLEFIHKLVLRLKGRKQKTINIKFMLADGYDETNIDDAINEIISEYDGEILAVEYVFDIETIASVVQLETDRLLKKIQ